MKKGEQKQTTNNKNSTKCDKNVSKEAKVILINPDGTKEIHTVDPNKPSKMTITSKEGGYLKMSKSRKPRIKQDAPKKKNVSNEDLMEKLKEVENNINIKEQGQIMRDTVIAGAIAQSNSRPQITNNSFILPNTSQPLMRNVTPDPLQLDYIKEDIDE
jgi:ribosome-binding protein aMBF1 (putative translation factor)